MTFNPVSSHGNGYPLALTGATGATRYVGATASGAPASGTFEIGDFVIDQTGKVYICTVAGTPGTWAQAGGGAPSGAAGGDLTGTYPNPTLSSSTVLLTTPSVRSTTTLAETWPRYSVAASGDGPLVSGRMYASAIYLPAGAVITSISFRTTAAGAVVAPTNQFFGLYDSALARLAVTADDGSTAWANATLKTLNLTAPYTTLTRDVFYLAVLVLATTGPTLYGIGATATNLPTTNPLWAAYDSSLSSLPNPATLSQARDTIPYARVI